MLHDSGRTPVSDLPSALCPPSDMGLLGDYYTEEGVCRMAYNYLAKTEKEKPTAQSA